MPAPVNRPTETHTGFTSSIAATGTILPPTRMPDRAEKIDLKTGRPVKVSEHAAYPLLVKACQMAMGGK